MVKLYHGTPIEITQSLHPKGPLLTAEEVKRINKPRSKKNKIIYRPGLRQGDTKPDKRLDFGAGFYLTEDREFACLRSRAGASGISYVYEYELGDDFREELKCYEFSSADLKWLLFTAFGRKLLKEEYAPGLYRSLADFETEFDIIAGPAADDRFYGMCRAFMAPENRFLALDHLMLIDILSRTNLQKQFVLKTEAACDCVKQSARIKLTPEETEYYNKLVNTRAKESLELTDRMYEEAVARRANNGSKGMSFKTLLEEIESEHLSFWEIEDNEDPEVTEPDNTQSRKG